MYTRMQKLGLEAVGHREIIVPTVLLKGIAGVATLGFTSLLDPSATATFVGIPTTDATALRPANRTMRPILKRASTDLSEQE